MSVSTQPDSKYLKYHSEEEDEGLGTAKFKQSDTFSLCSPHAEKADLHSSESDVRRYDEDSGVCNSSKATNSIGSLSDQDASESEGRGCYDYFPQSQVVKIHSGGGLHLDYDEVHEVQSDRSSQDVTSPRSDLEIEMTEIVPNRPDNNRDADFYTDDESDDDHDIHQSLYSSRSYKGDYNSMHRESKEEYAQFFSPNFEGSRGTWGSSAHSGLHSQGQVDEKIAFSTVLGGNIYSRYSNPCPRSELHTSSDKVKIEKNFYPNTTSKPPFGDGQDQLEKVGRSIQPLLDCISDAPVPNMPEARKLVPLFSEDNKKKKKKKKAPKDELAEKYEKNSLSDQHDEKGNPLESSPLTSGYRQMREPPALGYRGANPSSKSTYGTVGAFPQTLNSSDCYQHNNHQIKHLGELEDSPSSSKLHKKRRQRKVKEQYSQDVDDYKGNILDIDELVNFIAGKNVDNKKNKKCQPSTIAATATTDIPSKGEKNNKKVKDKKQKSTIPFSATEEETKGQIVIKEGNLDPETSKLEVHSVCESKDCLYKGMGNHSAKTECKLTDNHQKGGTIRVYDEEKLASLFTDSEEMGKLNIGSNKSTVISSSIIDLKCPKNNKISTKKDKQAESDISSTANNFDGEVHKNQEDKKWTEEGVGKADKTDKIVPSVNQCVKQKNFKSKSANSSDFVGSDSLTKPITPTSQFEDIGIGDVNSPFMVNSDIMDNTFIFTDIDDLHPVPQEDEFHVVRKKKKKAKDSNSLNWSKRILHSTHISSEEKHVYASGGKKSFCKPIPVTAIPIVADIDMKRDLSPSAFPALGKASSKHRKSLPDGRRNSTDEVPIPSEVSVKHLDDSDIESVKSLPVATEVKTDCSDFPRPLVSYASKAASTRPAGNKASNQASPIALSKERKEEAKYQVWKDELAEKYEKNSLSDPHDEKGNPLESSPLTSGYRQMREPPALGYRGANPSSKSTYGTVGGSPQTLNSFDCYQHNNHQIKHLGELEDSPSSSKLHKKCRQRKVKEQYSQDIDDYKGNILDIDELVNFIAGKNVDNKKNKKCQPSTIAATATTDIPSKGEKNNKKVKDKKQKSTIPFSATEEEIKGKIVIKEGNSDPETSKLEVHSVCESKDCLYKGMGSRSAKTEYIDDLHPVPQEDEFQVVGKKKKKAKDSNSLNWSKRILHSTL